MANNSSGDFPNMKRVAQITSAHCAPAVLRMLLSFWGVKIYQKEIVRAAGLDFGWLKVHGMNLKQVAEVVEKIAPDMQFWSKQRSSMGDLDLLVNQYKIPVGVEWQGIFGEYADDDDGHYSVITYLNLAENKIKLADPFGPFSEEDRVFTIKQFDTRWWDNNEIHGESTQPHFEYDENLMFIIAPKIETYPETLGMVRGAMEGERV